MSKNSIRKVIEHCSKKWKQCSIYLYLYNIISPGESLQISFKIALNQALERAGIKEIVVDSYYEEAIKVILKWKKEYKDTYEN